MIGYQGGCHRLGGIWCLRWSWGYLPIMWRFHLSSCGTSLCSKLYWWRILFYLVVTASLTSLLLLYIYVGRGNWCVKSWWCRYHQCSRQVRPHVPGARCWWDYWYYPSIRWIWSYSWPPCSTFLYMKGARFIRGPAPRLVYDDVFLVYQK